MSRYNLKIKLKLSRTRTLERRERGERRGNTGREGGGEREGGTRGILNAGRGKREREESERDSLTGGKQGYQSKRNFPRA